MNNKIYCHNLSGTFLYCLYCKNENAYWNYKQRKFDFKVCWEKDLNLLISSFVEAGLSEINYGDYSDFHFKYWKMDDGD